MNSVNLLYYMAPIGALMLFITSMQEHGLFANAQKARRSTLMGGAS